MIDLTAVSGLDLRLDPARLSLDFGPGIEHPAAETRTLAQVLPMMEDTHATGPDHLYTIYMDLYRRDDRQALHAQGLLYGAVIYNHGTIGREREYRRRSAGSPGREAGPCGRDCAGYSGTDTRTDRSGALHRQSL